MMSYSNVARLCATILALSLPGAAQPACTQDMIRGTWVDSITGFSFVPVSAGSQQLVPVPGVTLAIFKIDWQGHFTATGPASFAGQIATGDVAGTIQVNPDCTATANFTIQVPGMTPAPLPGVETLVIVDHGDQMWSLPSQEPLGLGVTLETLRRISVAEPQCSNDTVVGHFGIMYQGYAVGTAPVPISYVGTAAVDYQGTVSGGGTLSDGGAIANVTLADATLKINPDCTGTMQYSISGSNPALKGPNIDRLVALNDGDEIILMPVQSALGGPIMLGSMKRINIESGPPPTPAVTLAVTGQQNGTAYKAGDSFVLTIAAPAYANQAVAVAQNGGTPFQFGYTDAQGNWTLAGSWGARDVGSYTQTWYVGAVAATPKLTFSVTQ